MSTNIEIGGQEYDAKDLEFPASGRMFRDAWAEPQANVIQFDMATVKQIAEVRINVWRKAQEESGFTYAGKTIQSDERSADRIQGAVKLADIQEEASPGSFSIQWKAADNSFLTLDASGMRAMFSAMGAHIQSVFTESETKKAAVNSASTADEVKAVLDQL